MKVEYNRQGAARKELVQAISAITGEKARTVRNDIDKMGSGLLYLTYN